MPGWDSAPQVKNRVSSVNYDIGGPLISPVTFSTVKILYTSGLCQWYSPGLYLNLVPEWDSTPQAHSRMSNINFDSGGGHH